MNIVIKTLGCKANRYESDKLVDTFEDKYIVVDAAVCELKKADIIIVNTCSVTHVADRKSRQAITVLKHKYPDAKVIVFGCSSNIDPDGYGQLPNVDFVAIDREQLEGIVEKLSVQNDAVCSHDGMPPTRKRALIKIQDGCNNFCSYCIVPFARGREKSRPYYEIIEEIEEKIKQGYKEAVITGINIGKWKDNGKTLADLIELILKETTIERLRLSSIEPENFSEKFIEMFKNSRFCAHLHISLQSGSDTILKKMNRRYNTKIYSEMVKSLRKAVPNINITTDVIVGFPGETEGHFIETVNFIKEMKFSKIHIFPYSKRKGTVAAEMPDQIKEEIKKERCEYLTEIEKQLREDFYNKNLGRTEQVLIETIDEDGFATGFTSNYLKTRFHSKIKQNQIVNIKLEELTKNLELIGSLKA